MFLGIDLGTSGLRALLVSDTRVIGAAEASYDVSHPHPGWSEQDPALWITACQQAIGDLRAAHPEFAQLQGIAVAGHMHGAVLLGADDAVLRPCMLWNDTRAHVEAAQLDQTPHVRDLSGNIVFPGFTAPKVMWLAEHEPQIHAHIAKVLLPKDYLTFWLTGEHVSEMSDAAGTSWLDVGARDWSALLLTASGLRPDQMPRLVEGSEQAGHLRPALAQEWGLDHPVCVAGGGGDNAAAACGVGALDEGQGFVSLGTSGVLLAARDRFAPAPKTAVHTFCHAIPDTWYQMGVILAATDSLNWLSRQMGRAPSALTADLGDRITTPGHIRFLPYLSGERTPHNDARMRGAFLGLDISDGPQDLTRAVLEGVAFALRDCAEALAQTGARTESLLAIGGGTGSVHWVEMIATVLNTPLDMPAQGEFGAALGAARLAQCAATGANPREIMTPPPIDRRIHPRGDLTDSFDDAYQTWRATYPALKDLP